MERYGKKEQGHENAKAVKKRGGGIILKTRRAKKQKIGIRMEVASQKKKKELPGGRFSKRRKRKERKTGRGEPEGKRGKGILQRLRGVRTTRALEGKERKN